MFLGAEGFLPDKIVSMVMPGSREAGLKSLPWRFAISGILDQMFFGLSFANRHRSALICNKYNKASLTPYI